MPQLPSGFHFAIDPSPVLDLIEKYVNSPYGHHLMQIEHLGHLFDHVDVHFFRPRADAGVATQYAETSNLPPEQLEPYRSGYTLRTIKELYDTWPANDQLAFDAFLDQPRTRAFLQQYLDEVARAKQHLLSQFPALPGVIAHWWKLGCHPLQEDYEDRDTSKNGGEI